MGIYSSFSSSVAQDGVVSPFTESEKIGQFNKLVEVLNRLEPFKISVRNSSEILPTLAFYVEAMTFTYEKDWIMHMQLAIGKLEEFQRVFPDSSEAYRKSTMLLNQLISNLYKTTIILQISELQKIDSPTNKYKITTLNLLNNIYALKDKIFQEHNEKNISNPINNVAFQFYPTWYKKIDEQEASTYQS